jgi:hypothetical protein
VIPLPDDQSLYDHLIERARLVALDTETGRIDRKDQRKLAAEYISFELEGQSIELTRTVAANEIARRRVEATRNKTKLQWNEKQQRWPLLDPYVHITVAPMIDVLVKDALQRDWLAWRDMNRKRFKKAKEHQARVDDLVRTVVGRLPDDETRTQRILMELIDEYGPRDDERGDE